MTDLVRDGKLRNAPEEFAGVKLSADDLLALEAFLRALNEDYESGGGAVRGGFVGGGGAWEWRGDAGEYF